ncbi:MAG: hypothetical protein WBQ44_08590 [Rhodococcus sp. (in: high G+C Gram-positive bacteria)]
MITRSTVVLLVATGILFAIYPLLRPYSSEMGRAGAEAFASPWWVVAHVSATLGFLALALFVRQVRAGTLVEVTTLVGVALVLPYYGAETFALHALGTEALQTDTSTTGSSDLVALAEPIRYGAVQVTMFGVGLVLVAVGAVAFALRTGGRGALLFAAGFLLFLPQFFAPPWLRIAHGLLILVGALLMAVQLLRHAHEHRATDDQEISTTTGA